MSETTVTLIVAIISAFVALIGYANEKSKERESELGKIRRSIYQRFIKNLFDRETMRLSLNDPNMPKTLEPAKLYPYLAKNHPDLWKNITDAIEIQYLLSIYGSDEAVKSASIYLRKMAQCNNKLMNGESIQEDDVPNLQNLVLKLREAGYGKKTKVTEAEIAQLLTP